jgi:ComEC/Rec2-related protein
MSVYSKAKRSQVYLLMLIAVVILLQIARQIQIYQIQDETGRVELPPLIWRSTPSCWATSGPFRFKLDGCEQLREGTVILVTGRVTSSSDDGNFTQKRLTKTSFTTFVPAARIVAWSADLRTWLVTPVRQTVAYPEEVLVESFVLGSAVELPESIEHSVKVMGIAHVIAVSGSHLTLLIALLLPIVQSNKSTINTAIIVIFLVIYTTLVGWQPAVSRALWMAVILLMGKTVFHRQVHLGRALVVSAGLMFLLDPWVVVNIGWQLSVFATAGICWLYPSLHDACFQNRHTDDTAHLLEETLHPVVLSARRLLAKVARLSLEAGLASIAALAFIWPIMIANFGTWSGAGLVTSLVLWWLFPLVISSCFVGVIVIRALTLVSVYPPLVQICSSLLLEWPVRSVTWLFDRVDSLEWMLFEVDALPSSWYGLWYLALGCFLLYRQYLNHHQIRQSWYRLSPRANNRGELPRPLV